MFWASHTLSCSMQWAKNWQVWIIMLISTKRFGNSLGLCLPVFHARQIGGLSWMVSFSLQCLSPLGKRGQTIPFIDALWTLRHSHKHLYMFCVSWQSPLGPTRCLVGAQSTFVEWINEQKHVNEVFSVIPLSLRKLEQAADFPEPASGCH